MGWLALARKDRRCEGRFGGFGRVEAGADFGVAARLAQLLDKEQQRLFLWMPVLFGCGVALYFSLLNEPSWGLTLIVLAGAALFYLTMRQAGIARLLAGAVVLAGFGFADAKLGTWRAGAPVVVEESGVVTVRGWIEEAEPRGHGERLMVRVATISKFAPDDTPYRVRLQNNVKGGGHAAGDGVAIKAVLRPLPEPVRPAGFDFARRAWFQSLGAVGYTLGAPERVVLQEQRPWDLALAARLETLRSEISAHIRRALPGREGALADALITGKRGGIDEEALEDLRSAGLAHILAISGLHMVLMAGSFYWFVRALLALWPPLALIFPIKKYAAVAALCGGLFYLLISGGSIATQRAFIMIAIMFAAMLMERRALSLRNVALAALAILIPWPQSLFDVSFQMSFAAVTALVAVHEWRMERPRHKRFYPDAVWLRLTASVWRYFKGIGLTTLVASTAVAPFAIYHFHKLAQFGLLANLAAMPLVGLLIMPAALMALLVMPFGLESAPLAAMGLGIDKLIQIAHAVTALEGSVAAMPAMPAVSLALIVLGGLWLTLWRGPWRAWGIAGVLAGVLAAPLHTRPDVFIERDAKTFAVRNAQGVLAAPKGRKGIYSLEQWLRADGDGREAREAQHGGGYRCDSVGCIAHAKGKMVSFVLHPAALNEDCARGDIVIVSWPLNRFAYRACSQGALIIDRAALMKHGAHALYIDGGKITVVTAADIRGRRPWSSGALQRRERQRAGRANKDSKVQNLAQSPRRKGGEGR